MPERAWIQGLRYDSAMRALSIVFVLSALASTASAQVASSVTAPTPTPPPAGPTYAQRMREATEQIAHGDRAGAVGHLRDAIGAEPSRPDAHCLLAEGLRAGGDATGALESYQTCLRLARAEDNVLMIARALHGVASTYERLPEHLADARTAWMEYSHFADGATRVAQGSIGRDRVTAIDVMTEQERVYVDVRARIAERERIAAEAAAAPPTPPPTTARGRATIRPTH
jgi:hypothetical protein